MNQEQRQKNDQKRQVALKLGDAPEHQGNSYGNLNDSHLCCFPYPSGLDPRRKPRVLISVKYVDRGRSPGIGFYFEPPIKHLYLDKLKRLALALPPFNLDMNQINMRSRTKGWVVFCKNDCRTFVEMYKQIVQPGNSLSEWKALYDALKGWLKKEFGRVDYFDKECLAQDNNLTSDSFTSYP